MIVSASDDGLKIWDAYTGKCLKQLECHTADVNSAAFSPDGSLVVSASHDKTLKIWDNKTCECLKTLVGFENVVNTAI